MTGVSFVVTVYNKARFLPAVLGAIFAQEGDFAREYIFIDDGSHDDSVAVMERLCAGRPNVRIIRQANAGPAKATNAAVKAATLPWLKIVDGDDVLAPAATRLLLAAADRLGPRFALGGNAVYNDLAHVAFAPPPAAPAIRRRELFGDCLRNAPCNLTPTLIGRDRYWEVGGCDERLFTQDFSLLLRLAWREAPAEIDAVVSASPSESSGRVSDNQGLILKEINAAMLYFLLETRGVPFGMRYTAVERAFGRAWKWQRRREGASMASRWFWLYALAKLLPPDLAAGFLPKTLEAFTPTGRP
jgi:glycosyltransferase involved in cell wall biosynthesis